MTDIVSVVVPVFNEQDNIEHLVERLCSVFAPLEIDSEVILVDDGSSDGTWEEIIAIRKKFPFVRGCRLSRNFGHQGALLAGLNRATGNAIITMDGDLQHPPEIIPEMLAEWRKGAKIVLTHREDHGTTSFFKRISSRWFYQIFSSMTETEIKAGSSDFRLLDRRVLNELLSMKFGQPFLRGTVQTLGFPRTVVSFRAEKRFAGRTKYTLSRMFHFAKNGLISHSSVPLHVGIWLGLVTSFLSIAELLYVFIQYMSGKTVPGWASIVGIVSLFSGAIFFILGIIGLYLEDIHTLLKNKKHFIIQEDTLLVSESKSERKQS
jgi:dolichol-phosphate mannosyltransferase